MYDHLGECSSEKECFKCHFDNLSGSHLQSQVNCGMSVDGMSLVVDLIVDLIGHWYRCQ